jgi:IS5 family transposase
LNWTKPLERQHLPDESAILRLRHLLEVHNLSFQILATVNATMAAKGLLLKCGTVVDATLIAAPSSTKNSSGERDPEMHQTKKSRYATSRDAPGAYRQATTHQLGRFLVKVEERIWGAEYLLWVGVAGPASRVSRQESSFCALAVRKNSGAVRCPAATSG